MLYNNLVYFRAIELLLARIVVFFTTIERKTQISLPIVVRNTTLHGSARECILRVACANLGHSLSRLMTMVKPARANLGHSLSRLMAMVNPARANLGSALCRRMQWSKLTRPRTAEAAFSYYQATRYIYLAATFMQ